MPASRLRLRRNRRAGRLPQKLVGSHLPAPPRTPLNADLLSYPRSPSRQRAGRATAKEARATRDVLSHLSTSSREMFSRVFLNWSLWKYRPPCSLEWREINSTNCPLPRRKKREISPSLSVYLSE